MRRPLEQNSWRERGKGKEEGGAWREEEGGERGERVDLMIQVMRRGGKTREKVLVGVRELESKRARARARGR